eukprot:1143406-Rhodomonas_salina.2
MCCSSDAARSVPVSRAWERKESNFGKLGLARLGKGCRGGSRGPVEGSKGNCRSPGKAEGGRRNQYCQGGGTVLMLWEQLASRGPVQCGSPHREGPQKGAQSAGSGLHHGAGRPGGSCSIQLTSTLGLARPPLVPADSIIGAQSTAPPPRSALIEHVP